MWVETRILRIQIQFIRVALIAKKTNSIANFFQRKGTVYIKGLFINNVSPNVDTVLISSLLGSVFPNMVHGY